MTQELLYENYPDICQRLIKHFGCDSEDIIIKRRFGEGKSGDIVLLISVNTSADISCVGDYVLKISATNGTTFSQEIANTHEAIIKTNNNRIIVPELRIFNLNGPGFYLYDVAGNDLIEAENLKQQIPRKKADRLYEISENLLTTWNENITFHASTLRDIIITWIEERRIAQGSRLNQRINRLINDELTPYFCYGDNVLPNPMFFLCNPNGVFTQDKAFIQTALYGQKHGDLNANNILIQPLGPRQGYKYFLIDFEQYQPSAPLLFDNAYLLLSILLDEASMTSLADWYEQANAFFNSFYDGELMTLSCNDLVLYIVHSRC